MAKKRCLLIEMREGVLEHVVIITGAKKAREILRELRKEVKAGEGWCDEAHLFEITSKSASGVSLMDSFSADDL